MENFLKAASIPAGRWCCSFRWYRTPWASDSMVRIVVGPKLAAVGCSSVRGRCQCFHAGRCVG